MGSWGSGDQCILENEMGEWVFYVYCHRSKVHTLFSWIPTEAGIELQMEGFNSVTSIWRHGCFMQGWGRLCCYLLGMRDCMLTVLVIWLWQREAECVECVPAWDLLVLGALDVGWTESCFSNSMVCERWYYDSSWLKKCYMVKDKYERLLINTVNEQLCI